MLDPQFSLSSDGERQTVGLDGERKVLGSESKRQAKVHPLAEVKSKTHHSSLW